MLANMGATSSQLCQYLAPQLPYTRTAESQPQGEWLEALERNCPVPPPLDEMALQVPVFG